MMGTCLNYTFELEQKRSQLFLFELIDALTLIRKVTEKMAVYWARDSVSVTKVL